MIQLLDPTDALYQLHPATAGPRIKAPLLPGSDPKGSAVTIFWHLDGLHSLLQSSGREAALVQLGCDAKQAALLALEEDQADGGDDVTEGGGGTGERGASGRRYIKRLTAAALNLRRTLLTHYASHDNMFAFGTRELMSAVRKEAYICLAECCPSSTNCE